MSAARPDTWMPLYWGDYAKATAHLSAAQHGAYLMLLKHYWSIGGPLPDDDGALWRIACADSPAHPKARGAGLLQDRGRRAAPRPRRARAGKGAALHRGPEPARPERRTSP